MRLPIPVVADNGSRFSEVEIKKPNSGLVADTKKLIDSNPNMFIAVKQFVSGIIVSIDDVSDPIALKGLTKNLPYRSAEYLMIQAFILRNPDNDGVEGVYPCPRCGTQVISEAYEKDGIEYDTRDFLSNLEIVYADFTSVEINLLEPIEIKNLKNGEILYSIESIQMSYPTLEHCIQGYNACSDKKDDIRLQFNIYAQALTHINGAEIDSKFRSNFGAILFEKIDNDEDLYKISNAMQEYGLNNKVKKNCPNCSKNWITTLNTNNFFVSSLNV